MTLLQICHSLLHHLWCYIVSRETVLHQLVQRAAAAVFHVEHRAPRAVRLRHPSLAPRPGLELTGFYFCTPTGSVRLSRKIHVAYSSTKIPVAHSSTLHQLVQPPTTPLTFTRDVAIYLFGRFNASAALLLPSLFTSVFK